MSQFKITQKINSNSISALMRDVVLRANAEIRSQKRDFTAFEKEVNYKDDIDYVTTADKNAQKIYLEFLSKNFPSFGIIAEEDDLFKKAIGQGPGKKHFFYFTIDPLDGTKAFKRRQSTGFSSMLGLIHECPSEHVCEVVASVIGDPMTGELYFTRIDSPRAHLLDTYSREHDILEITNTSPKDQYILLRDNPRAFSKLANKAFDGYRRNAFFKDFELQGGSIGLSFAMLWKGQYGGLLLKPGKTTVWDTAPVIAISQKLGFVPVEYHEKAQAYHPGTFRINASRELMEQKETIIMHRSLVPKFIEWQAKQLKK